MLTKAAPVVPVPTVDPLTIVLRSALRRTGDPAVRRWLRRLLRGKRASDQSDVTERCQVKSVKPKC